MIIKIKLTVSNFVTINSVYVFVDSVMSLGIHSELDTLSYQFFLTVTDTVPSQNIDLNVWTTRYTEDVSWESTLHRTRAFDLDQCFQTRVPQDIVGVSAYHGVHK